MKRTTHMKAYNNPYKRLCSVHDVVELLIVHVNTDLRVSHFKLKSMRWFRDEVSHPNSVYLFIYLRYKTKVCLICFSLHQILGHRIKS